MNWAEYGKAKEAARAKSRGGHYGRSRTPQPDSGGWAVKTSRGFLATARRARPNYWTQNVNGATLYDTAISALRAAVHMLSAEEIHADPKAAIFFHRP
jgi:hypothetical protein